MCGRAHFAGTIRASWPPALLLKHPQEYEFGFNSNVVPHFHLNYGLEWFRFSQT